jgi:phage shock protein C
MNRRLYRSRTDAPWTGVAGGVAEWLRIDPSLVRVAWVVLALLTAGMAALVYLVMWAVVPVEPETRAAATGPAESTKASAAVASRPRTGETRTVATPPTTEPLTEAARSDGSGALVVGLILIGLGVFFLAQQYLPAFQWGRVWPVVLVIVGAVVLITSYRRGNRAG